MCALPALPALDDDEPQPRFLIIDDEPAVRDLVAAFLEREFPGCTTLPVADREAFDRHLDDGGFDLVVTDYQVGWSDGLEILRIVKQRYPHCPVIMFTGTGSEAVAAGALKAGFDDYIIKDPEHQKFLPMAVRNALEIADSNERAARAEEALTESERKYRFLVESAGQPIFTINPDGVFTFMNSAAAEALGGRPDDFTGSTMWDLFPRELADGQMNSIRQAFAERHYSVSVRKTRVRGEERWYHALIQPVDDNTALVILTDLTERKAMENELDSANLFLNSLIEQSPFPTFVIDRDGTSVKVNEAFCRHHGLPDSSMALGIPVLEFPPVVEQGVDAYLHRALNGETVTTPETSFISPADGSCRITVTTAFPVRDFAGEITHAVCIHQDVTEAVENRERLRASEKKYRTLVE